MAENVIGLDKWSPNIDPDVLDGLLLPIWVRLQKLSLMYWDNTNIAYIASFLGEPLWVDHQTNEWGQSMYSSVCACINLAKKFPPEIWVNGKHGRFFQKFEYKGISLLCFQCGKIGHKIDRCPMAKAKGNMGNHSTHMLLTLKKIST